MSVLLMLLAKLTRLHLRLKNKFRRFFMPVGSVSRNEEKFDLETLPGAFIIVRRMTYGEKLSRQDEMFSMRANMEKNNSQLEMALLNKKMALLDFGNLVLDHNITDESERKLNFKNAADVLSLDPRIGDEISYFIDRINSFDGTQDLKN